MPLQLQIFIISLSALILAGVIRCLITQNFSERDSILWFLIVGVCVVMSLFPDLLTDLARMVGIDYPPTLLFLVAILILIMITFKNSLDLSKLKDENRELISQLSLLLSEEKPENESTEPEKTEKITK